MTRLDTLLEATTTFFWKESQRKNRSSASRSQDGRGSEDEEGLERICTLKNVSFQDLLVRKRGEEGESFSRGVEEIHCLWRSSEAQS